jgi:hypothetical protein
MNSRADIAVVAPWRHHPDGEGSAAVFRPAYWQPQSNRRTAALAAAPRMRRPNVRHRVVGAIRPARNLDGIRVPLAAITTVEVHETSPAPRQLTVETCAGRPIVSPSAAAAPTG